LEVGALFLPLFAVYFYWQTRTIFGGDSGDLAAAALTGGIAHPPGYPLWTFLGVLLLKLPWLNPAWRLAFLSSVPGALTLVFLYLVISKITRQFWPAFLAILVLAFNYVFWLYSEVVEVFSLNNFLAVLFIWLFLRLNETAKNGELKKLLLVVFFLTGLVLSHHHTLLLIFPGLGYLLWQQKTKIIFLIKKNFKIYLAAFILALLPLLYLPLAAGRFPAVDWGHPTNLLNFLKLFFRHDYGIFLANSGIVNQPLLRLASLVFLFDFFRKDFLILGLLLALLGGFFLWRRQRRLFWFFLIEFSSYLFFVFYASFSLENDFGVATFERFLLLPYLFLTIFIGCGLALSFEIFRPLVFLKKLKILPAAFLVYPLSIFLINYPLISQLKNDFTAENFAKDILASVPRDGILLLVADTPLFDTQYFYYAYRYRPDVKLIHFSKLFREYYKETLRKYYPDLRLPSVPAKEFPKEFIRQNQEIFPILANTLVGQIEGSLWLPQGLLQRYYPSTVSTPSASLVFEENERLWAAYQQPLLGERRRYQNLFTADILNYYYRAHRQTGTFFLENGYLEAAQKHFVAMAELKPKNPEVYYYLGWGFLTQKDCVAAERQFQKMLELDPKNVEARGFLRQTYLECFQDPVKAKEYEESCLQLEKSQQPKLKEL